MRERGGWGWGGKGGGEIRENRTKGTKHDWLNWSYANKSDWVVHLHANEVGQNLNKHFKKRPEFMILTLQVTFAAVNFTQVLRLLKIKYKYEKEALYIMIL